LAKSSVRISKLRICVAKSKNVSFHFFLGNHSFVIFDSVGGSQSTYPSSTSSSYFISLLFLSFTTSFSFSTFAGLAIGAGVANSSCFLLFNPGTYPGETEEEGVEDGVEVEVEVEDEEVEDDEDDDAAVGPLKTLDFVVIAAEEEEAV
jgi:hypothetical protein